MGSRHFKMRATAACLLTLGGGVVWSIGQAEVKGQANEQRLAHPLSDAVQKQQKIVQPDQKQEEAIQEAVLRALIAAYGQSVPHEIYFLGVGPRQDPPPSLLQRFHDHQPPIVALSRAAKPGERQRKGTRFVLGPIKWRDKQQVEVSWRWVYDIKAGMGGVYRLGQTQGQWKVQGIVPGSIWKN